MLLCCRGDRERYSIEGTIPVQVDTFSAPRVPQPVQLGDTVPPPVGADYHRRWRHVHTLDVRQPCADNLELHAYQHRHQCRGTHRYCSWPSLLFLLSEIVTRLGAHIGTAAGRAFSSCRVRLSLGWVHPVGCFLSEMLT